MESKCLRSCSNSIVDYLKSYSDKSTNNVLEHLEVILNNDVDFDPASTTAAQFFTRLHELVIGLNLESPLLWASVNVIEKACKNPFAKYAIIHTYKFVPALTRFVNKNMAHEKLQKLLFLLLELTYGLQITWQEANLPNLVSTLIDIILNGEQSSKPSALGILVNLCYRNQPVVYVLARNIEITTFIKKITKMNDNPTIRMQVCRMLITLQQLKGDLPEADILNFVDVTFNTVADAYQQKDDGLLRTIVDFFYDIQGNPYCCKVISSYPKCYEDAKRVLDFIDNVSANDFEGPVKCLRLILKFIPAILSTNLQKTGKLMPRALDIAARFLQNEVTVLESLNIIQMVTQHLSSPFCPNGGNGVVSKLTKIIPTIVNLMAALEPVIVGSRVKRKLLTSVVSVLSCIVKSPQLTEHIYQYVSLDCTRRIFHVLYKGPETNCEFLQNSDRGELCIRLLSMISTLASSYEEWRHLNAELLNKRTILSTLAQSFFEGDKDIKYELLLLMNSPGWEKDVVSALSDCMSEKRPTFSDQVNVMMTPSLASSEQLFPYSQESRLNELLDFMKAEKDGGRLSDTSTSAVMELYNFKLASMEQSEKMLKCSLEAADLSCTRLNHQVAQLRGEVTHSLQLLFTAQQCVEGATLEKNDLIKKLKTLSEQAALEKNIHSRQLKELKSHIQNRDAQISSLKTTNEEITQACDNVKTSLADLTTKHEDVLTKNASLQDSLQQATEKLSDCQTKIDELETIRRMVLNVAARNKNAESVASDDIL